MTCYLPCTLSTLCQQAEENPRALLWCRIPAMSLRVDFPRGALPCGRLRPDTLCFSTHNRIACGPGKSFTFSTPALAAHLPFYLPNEGDHICNSSLLSSR